jgi:catechol 2,3-dioxygenase-like lactoylglutathione lyase family enzyme
MSYVAFATNHYNDAVEFYGELLGFPVVDRWDRPNARGMRFDLGSMRVEIFDNLREKSPLDLGTPADRIHLVVEVDDIDKARDSICIKVPVAQATSWGAILFQVRDPDGVPITFLQWQSPKNLVGEKIHGRVSTGIGRGKHFARVDWACRQFIDKLGLDPFPGTVNVSVDNETSMSVWRSLKGTPGVRIDNPNSSTNDCNARCYPVLIGDKVDAAIVLPEVSGYSPNRIEIIAETEVREALGLNDGDPLFFEIK